MRIKLLRLLNFVPDKAMVSLQYRLKTGRKLNLKNPKRFTEKLQWYKLYYRDPVMAQCSDKADVRQYVADKGLSHILTTCYGVYENSDQIDYPSLPNSFVMKDTLGGGGNSVLICKDKANLAEEALKAKADEWLEVGKERKHPGREWVYCQSKHRVMIEEYLPSDSDVGLVDYKFFCFNGTVKYIYIICDRALGEKAQLGIFDEHFVQLPYYRADEKKMTAQIPKPDTFDEMMEIAQTLSADFPEVRIDLYDIAGRVVFGEMTYFDGSGYMPFDPDSFDTMFGEAFMLPEKRLY